MATEKLGEPMSSRGVIILGVIAAFLLFAGAYLVDYLEKINYTAGRQFHPIQVMDEESKK